ncbi:universal stress protein [Streptomyces sp. NPDC048385]|uniref:universal stress protein n=1 Tax=unclassified Streptomyces TaxID=2593676 RepID=UPI003421C674
MPAAPFHRILVGWDASPAAHHALTTAMTIADGDGLVIARAVLTPSPHTETSGEQRRDLDAQRHWLQEQFDKTLRTATTHGAQVRLEWGESGEIWDDLHACAEHHCCDLIVVGRHGGEGSLRTAGLGPVARALAQEPRLPVLLVSAAGDNG